MILEANSETNRGKIRGKRYAEVARENYGPDDSDDDSEEEGPNDRVRKRRELRKNRDNKKRHDSD